MYLPRGFAEDVDYFVGITIENIEVLYPFTSFEKVRSGIIIGAVGDKPKKGLVSAR